MGCYFFCLGRILPLSLLEMQSLLSIGDSNLIGSTVWVRADREVNCEEYIWASGGTIKCGKCVNELAYDGELSNLIAGVASILKNEIRGSGVFAIHCDQLPDGLEMHSLLMKVKKALKEEGISSRFVDSEDNSGIVSSAISYHEIVSKEGVELVLSFDGDKIFVGRLVAVQNPDEWSRYDFGRPKRRIKDGMLPPKLARIMINIGLSKVRTENATPHLLDPFCGSGTVLSEAARIGLCVSGVDISEGAVESAQMNLKWLSDQMSKSGKPYSIHPFFNYFFTRSIDKKSMRVGDATHIDKMFASESVDLIVTEPFMGKLVCESGDLVTLKNRMRGLDKLYLGFLKSAHKVLKTNGVIVFTEPFFRYQSGVVYSGIVDRLESIGYTLVSSSVEYQRENTFVGRRVLVMGKE